MTQELISNPLASEFYSLEALRGIQRGLDDFEAGSFRSFDEYANEQRFKHNLPA